MSEIGAVPYDDAKDGTVKADGTVTVSLAPTQSYMTWVVHQVTTEYRDAPIGSLSEIRKRGVLITDLIPTGDVAGGDPPVTVRPGESLDVRWTGATPGDLVRVWWSYDQIDPRNLGR